MYSLCEIWPTVEGVDNVEGVETQDTHSQRHTHSTEILKQTQKCIQVHTHTRMPTHTQAHSLTHIYRLTSTHTHRCATDAHSLTDTLTNTHTHQCTHSLMNTGIHTHSPEASMSPCPVPLQNCKERVGVWAQGLATWGGSLALRRTQSKLPELPGPLLSHLSSGATEEVDGS